MHENHKKILDYLMDRFDEWHTTMNIKEATGVSCDANMIRSVAFNLTMDRSNKLSIKNTRVGKQYMWKLTNRTPIEP